MENQKVENALNLALDATNTERLKSLDLNVGYNQSSNTWEVIIKCSSELTSLKENYQITPLINTYAIVNVLESELPNLAAEPQIEYIEKPKNLFYNRTNGLRTSCITSLQRGESALTGDGIIVAVIDSGIDYRNNDFRNPDGTTRILYLWDQSIPSQSPNEYNKGTIYTQTDINNALETSSDSPSTINTVDITGHGTAVASIAAGNNGVANKAGLIVVKLGNAQKGGFPRTIELMLALDFVVKKAMELNMPLSINLSFGNTYGAHNGDSLLESYIDDISNYWKTSIAVSSGNEGNSAGHVEGKLTPKNNDEIELAVDTRQTSFNIQIWKKYEDQVNISIRSPDGTLLGPLENAMGTNRFLSLSTELLIYYGEPSPYSSLQEIYIEFIPQNQYITPGIWTIIISPIRLVSGEYNLWLPSSGVLSEGTAFLRPSKSGTITIPGTSNRVITVGAYDSLTFDYADFSGRGLNNAFTKPDLLAPGVDILVSGTNNNPRIVSGTSFATPFVCGSSALLMEWGIIQGNDIYLYGEKIKAYLHSGAKRIESTPYPNIIEGYGLLCLEDSIPN